MFTGKTRCTRRRRRGLTDLFVLDPLNEKTPGRRRVLTCSVINHGL